MRFLSTLALYAYIIALVTAGWLSWADLTDPNRLAGSRALGWVQFWWQRLPWLVSPR